MRLILLAFCCVGCCLFVVGQDRPYKSSVWAADLGNGFYRNPVLHADYSDPDVCRVGDDYYLVSSSFNAVPGLPLLHSKDLVNWSLIGHALKVQSPLDYYDKPRHGGGVWAPAIRYHNRRFYIYYPDPDFGIYLVTAEKPEGPWSDPILVLPGKGLIDPCPLWDEDGQAYLIHAYAGSRAGIKSILVIRKMTVEGTRIIDDGILVYDGHSIDPTIEGPKLYKRNGFYYIFAPAGGVSTGWQVVLRSKNIYGPYDRKVVLAQGKTDVNGPHQGAWIDTKTGKDWFIHFQDKFAYGRVVHLQPMKWVYDWPVIGDDKDGDGKGEPYSEYRKPVAPDVVKTPIETDEFAGPPGLQWQWQANPGTAWSFTGNNGSLRLYARAFRDAANLWDVPNILLQKFPAPEFTATTRLLFHPLSDGDRTGLVVMGLSYAWIGLERVEGVTYLVYGQGVDAENGQPEQRIRINSWEAGETFLRVAVRAGGSCSFSFSRDGKKFEPTGEPFVARPGKWVGAKVGLFCVGRDRTNDSGFADVDWFRVEK